MGFIFERRRGDRARYSHASDSGAASAVNLAKSSSWKAGDGAFAIARAQFHSDVPLT